MVRELAAIESRARVPEELPRYVKSVSGLKSQPCGKGILHTENEVGVLSIFPDSGNCQEEIDIAVEKALQVKQLKTISVLAPLLPKKAPPNASVSKDFYWSIDPAAKIPAKTLNMIRRAKREVQVQKNNGDCWTKKHGELVEEFCNRKQSALSDADCYIFNQLGEYLKNSPQASLFSAYANNGKLAGCIIGDLTSFTTAFYMFAFRAIDAPPGTADLLLYELVREAKNSGQSRLNLGLGINPGVSFFKKKWGATPWLEYVETTWPIRKKNWFGRFFGKK